MSSSSSSDQAASRRGVSETDVEVLEAWPTPPTSIAFRTPMPSGARSASVGIARYDGGWQFQDEDAGQRCWTPDSNVIAVVVGEARA